MKPFNHFGFWMCSCTMPYNLNNIKIKTMKYYRLKLEAKNWSSSFTLGKIYPEITEIGYNTITSWVINYPDDFEEVTERDYLIQEGKLQPIGYKLKEGCEKYRDACIKINEGFTTSYFMGDVECLSKDANLVLTRLKEAGVLDLWFEPVYEEQFKVSDWVTIEKNGSVLEDGCWGCPIGTFKITDKPHTYGLSKSDVGSFNVEVTSTQIWRISSKGVRKATSEEIEAKKPKYPINMTYLEHGNMNQLDVKVYADKITFIEGEWDVIHIDNSTFEKIVAKYNEIHGKTS